ncbi:MAG: Hsp20/alpha crystallin family protein [Verrucomicrobia bacterium]|nr:Hsp20/alpha crystallin family protein [Verrucomicrobiota bacterium]
MTKKMIRSFPMSRFPFFEEEGEEEWLPDISPSSGLSVSEDEQNVYVEAAVPGLKPEEIEVSYDQGILWIKGEKKEQTEDKSKKFYRKAMTSFSYRIAVPGNVDESKPLEATCKNGIIRIVFPKAKQAPSKKIPIKNT